MATIINGVNGSPLFGSPLNVSITADSPAGDITFHQVKLTVTAHIQNGTARDYEFARPVRNGETVLIDICTALQAAFSAYVYESTPPGAYPYVAFSLKAWDEYVLNGESHTTTAAELGGMRALAGAFSDMERLIAGDGGRATAKFSRKPNTSPEIVMVGEQYVHAVDMEVTIGNITHGQQSAVTNITTEGMLTIDGRQVYAVAAGDTDRYQFRFINGLGAMESVSVKVLRTSETNITSEKRVISRHETFGTFSRGTTKKQNDHETWRMTSGPVDEAWQSWFIHEFLMTEIAWVLVNGQWSMINGQWSMVNGVWVPCHIVTDETVSGISREKADMLQVDFSVELDIDGSPMSALLT